MSSPHTHAKNPIFIYQGTPFMRVVPTKRLFNSTMVHEVVTRGDFFAVDLQTRRLTVLPHGADDPVPLSLEATVK